VEDEKHFLVAAVMPLAFEMVLVGELMRPDKREKWDIRSINQHVISCGICWYLTALVIGLVDVVGFAMEDWGNNSMKGVYWCIVSCRDYSAWIRVD
jgi:hypothetical protein